MPSFSLTDDNIELSIVMPCLNEAETLGVCVRKASAWLRDNHVRGEVIVADNGSTDGSREIATELGARLVPISARGYGAALQGGFASSRGQFVIMGDSDDSYDFTRLQPFLDKLREGYDLVMGNRFKGGIEPGAMPPLHQFFGNPFLTAIARIMFRAPIGDINCGLRGFRREAMLALNLRTTGMEFASEMVVRAQLAGLKITEVPTTLKPDGRSRKPHMRSFRDGWRNLRFYLIYSPNWLFLYPGLVLIGLGLLLWLLILPGPLRVGGVNFEGNTLLYAAMSVIVGFQAVWFAVFTKAFAVSEGLMPEDLRMSRLFSVFTLERGLVLGATLFALGIFGSAFAFFNWQRESFGNLDYPAILRVTIPSVTLIVLGCQLVLSSFFMSVLGLRRR